MTTLPPELHEEFPNKKETFYTISEIVLTNHGQQLTTEEIAEHVEPGKEGVQQHLRTLEEEGWINGFDGPKSYTWNTQKHNPAEQNPQEAVWIYSEGVLSLFRRSLRSPTEMLAFAAVIGVLVAVVLAISAVLAILLPVGSGTSQGLAYTASGFAVGSMVTVGILAFTARLMPLSV